MFTQFANGYALLIGINENQVADWSLPDVAKDVTALAQVLQHPERCAYLPDNVRTITGRTATRQGILGGLAWLQERIQADANATVVLYYSGHGWRDAESNPPEFYLIPYDVSNLDLELSALKAADFARAVNRLKPKRLLVILDCCHAAGMEVKDVTTSGYLANALPPTVFMPADSAAVATNAKGLELLQMGAGRAVLSSSQGEQKSYIRRDRKMSIFTYHLIEALTGHAQPQAGATEVLVSDVMSYMHRHVPQSAKAEANAAQDPDYQVSGNFPVALLLGGKGLSPGEPAPDPLRQLDTPAAIPVRTRIDTGGGAYISGLVDTGGGAFVGRDQISYGDHIGVRRDQISHGDHIGGGDFVGRDRVVHGDKVSGDKVGGDKVGGDKVGGDKAVVDNSLHASHDIIIVQGDTPAWGSRSQTNLRNTIDPLASLIKEPIRLDVAYPKTVHSQKRFDLAVAIRRPSAPVLALKDLTKVTSAEGALYRSKESDTVRYRIEVDAPDCKVQPKKYIIYLKTGDNSPVNIFRITAKREGKISILVNAFQDDKSLAAQTRVLVMAKVFVVR